MSKDTKSSGKIHTGSIKLLDIPNRVLVPVELVQHSWYNKIYSQLRIYLTLKLFTTGRLCLDEERISSVMDLCQIKTRKTFLKHIHWLITNNWLCQDVNHNIIFIKSFDHIHKILGFTGTKAVVFRPTVIENFRVWCGCVLVAKKCNEISYAVKRREKDKRRFSVKAKLTARKCYIGLSDSRVAKLLGVCNKGAWNIKRQGDILGFLKIKKRFKFISDNPLFYNHYKKYECSSALRVYKNKLWERSYDEIESNLLFAKRTNEKKVVK